MKHNNIQYSQHFLNDRMHRGISEDLIKAILYIGEFTYDKRQARIYRLTEKSFRNMKKIGMKTQDIEYYRKKKSVQLVVAIDTGMIITAMYENNSRSRLH